MHTIIRSNRDLLLQLLVFRKEICNLENIVYVTQERNIVIKKEVVLIEENDCQNSKLNLKLKS